MPLITTNAHDLSSFSWIIASDLTPKNIIVDIAKDQLFCVVFKGEIIGIMESGQHSLPEVLGTLHHQIPSSVDLYCFSTKMFSSLGWGTAIPLQIREKDGSLLTIRGHGTYGFILWNPKTLWRFKGGIQGSLSAADLQIACRSIILSILQNNIQTLLEAGSIVVEQIVSLPAQSKQSIQDEIKTEFRLLGLDLCQFTIDHLSFS